MERQPVQACAPATVANLGFGEGVLGLALALPENRVVAEHRAASGLEIAAVEGPEGEVLTEEDLALATAVARATLRQAGLEIGARLSLQILAPRGVGLGCQAATAAAVAFALNKLMGSPLRKQQLVQACLAAGAETGATRVDHVVPALLGGLTLIRSGEPLDVVRLPLSAQLMAVVVVPTNGVTEEQCRARLAETMSRTQLCAAVANLGAFASACLTHDLGLMARSLGGGVLYPEPQGVLAGLGDAITAGLDAGALGSSLVGPGPAAVALCRSQRSAAEVARAMSETLAAAGVAAQTFVSPADSPGARSTAE